MRQSFSIAPSSCRRYRAQLLQGGMRIHEIHPNAGRALFVGSIGAGAHVRGEASAFFNELMLHAAYQVRLKPGSDDALEWWRIDSNPPARVTDDEPGADLPTRVRLYLQSLVIPESML